MLFMFPSSELTFFWRYCLLLLRSLFVFRFFLHLALISIFLLLVPSINDALAFAQRIKIFRFDSLASKRIHIYMLSFFIIFYSLCGLFWLLQFIYIAKIDSYFMPIAGQRFRNWYRQIIAGKRSSNAGLIFFPLFSWFIQQIDNIFCIFLQCSF